MAVFPSQAAGGTLSVWTPALWNRRSGTAGHGQGFPTAVADAACLVSWAEQPMEVPPPLWRMAVLLCSSVGWWVPS